MSAQPNRLPEGGRIDRTRPLSFRFNRKTYEGFAGDTLASALLANDVHLVGRSFKLHRPRGIVGLGPEEPNAIVQIGRGATTTPNLRATQVALEEALEAHPVRGWPGLRYDLGYVADFASRLFGAGFYYKTFMSPQRSWPVYEKLIRRAAGFGSSPTEPDTDRYEHVNVHCDVLVAGAGPAGLMAALAAAKSGARVIVADELPEVGGTLRGSREALAGKSADDWLEDVVSELDAHSDVTLLTRACVSGYFDHNFLTIVEDVSGHVRQRQWRARARQVVLAQGAFERPLVFCNNDRPGVMMASAVSTYINRYAVRAGSRAVVFTNNDSGYRTALDLRRAGADVEAVVDSRLHAEPVEGEALTEDGVPLLRGHVVCDVAGVNRVRAVRVAKWNGDISTPVDATINIDCDLVAMSGGFSPAVHLFSQSGGRIEWDLARHCFVPGDPVQACRVAGAANGMWSLAECLGDGLAAGRAAAEACGFEAPELDAPAVDAEHAIALEPLWRVPATTDPDRCPKQFIDFQNDVSVADVRLAVREGYRNVEHVKRYTALGFGTDQGKLGNINGMAVLAECLDEPIARVGTTTFRPPYTPVSFGVAAGEGVGDLYDPVRKTAIHEWHEEAGAEFENVGQWHRPWYFPRDGENLHAAVARECVATRRSLGIMDASTLGKIDVRGPDAVTFLERIYTHDVGKMQAGRCAYGIMLGEDGMLKDDGVMARLSEQRFYLTTTTGGAAAVLAWLESWLQTEWPELDVYLTSLTDQYSTIAVAGPNSRRLLEKVGCDIDLSHDAFPFMSTREAELANVPVSLFRVSFSGELAFEVNIDSGHALAMWRLLMDAGGEFDITPYGTETMHVLRAEKGYVIVGQDTDGSVTPVDLGMKWMLSKEKDYLGRRSLARPDSTREDRKQFVGLLSVDGSTVVPEGAQLVDDSSAQNPVPMCGHVTSSYRSACLGHPIALGLVAAGRARKGETVYACAGDVEPVPVTITSPVFYDPKGDRQRDG